jgi:hypothetical protein
MFPHSPSSRLIEGGYQMNQTSCFATSTLALHCALELSKKSWLLAIQFPDREQPSVYSIKGGDTEKFSIFSARSGRHVGILGNFVRSLPVWTHGWALLQYTSMVGLNAKRLPRQPPPIRNSGRSAGEPAGRSRRYPHRSSTRLERSRTRLMSGIAFPSP